MKNITDSTTEADIYLSMWIDGMSPNEISRRMGVPVKDIYPLLKEAQKAIVAKAKEKNHAKKKNKG